MGHIISQQGVAVDSNKIKSIIDWHFPKNITGLRVFFGLTGYYRKFIRGYGIVAAPLTALLKKNSFSWNSTAEAFNHLKEVLTQPPVLSLPNLSKAFVIECDACGVGIGVVLMQDQRPIAYFSKALKGRELSVSTYEKEMLALVKSIQLWRPYLLGRPFVVGTDQRGLKYLFTTPNQQRWLPKILGFDYTVEYKKGAANRVADALSRQAEFQCSAVSLANFGWWSYIEQEVQDNEFYGTIKTMVESSNEGSINYQFRDGVWFYKGKVLLSPTSVLIPQVLAAMHSFPTSGHSGYHKTLARVRNSFHWKGMRTTVREYIRNCEVCQIYKNDTTKQGGLLQPLPIPDQIWTDVSMDFIEGLLISRGNFVILVVVDRLSKYAHFYLFLILIQLLLLLKYSLIISLSSMVYPCPL